MYKTPKFNVEQEFEDIYTTLSRSSFLNKEGLNTNKPIFIQPYPIADQVEVDRHISHLVKRLQQNNVPVLLIDLYDLCLSALKDKGILDKVFHIEPSRSKREFKRDINGSLDVLKVILPAISKAMAANEHMLIIIAGVDKIFPFLSFINVLVNIQSILNNEPFVIFYPGRYDNYSLLLFDNIPEDNEYRAFNLNNYK